MLNTPHEVLRQGSPLSANIIYTRRTHDGLITTSNPAELFRRLEGLGRVLDVRLAARRRRGDRRRPDVSGRFGRRGPGPCGDRHRRPDGLLPVRAAPQHHEDPPRRRREKAYQILGLPPDGLRFIECPDCNLNAYRGRHFTTIGAPTEIEGAGGMQNAITYALRQVRPNRVFLPTSADLHPDHQIVHEEVLISLFHAQGNIWPELGEPIAEVPKVYEFAVYCDFPEPPQIRIETPPAMLETKLQAILAFASQEQIGTLVEMQRNAGPIEYFRELEFHFYSPRSTIRCSRGPRDGRENPASKAVNHNQTCGNRIAVGWVRRRVRARAIPFVWWARCIRPHTNQLKPRCTPEVLDFQGVGTNWDVFCGE